MFHESLLYCMCNNALNSKNAENWIILIVIKVIRRAMKSFTTHVRKNDEIQGKILDSFLQFII